MTSRLSLRGLELPIAGALAAVVLGAAAGSSIQRTIFDVGRPARWLFLLVLVAVAAAAAAAAGRSWRVRTGAVVPVVAFAALAVVSLGWSANVHATAGRALGQALVLGALIALVGTVAAQPSIATRLVDGVLAGVAGVAVASALYWLVSRGGAVQAASTEYPARFRGIEQNPNTAAMLLAIGLPLALARTLDGGRSGRARAAAAALLALAVVEIVASGSRGGLLAGFGGMVVVAALMPLRARTRALAAAAIVAALCVSAWISTLPQALPASAATAPAAAPRHRGIDAETVLPLMGEVGSPYWEHRAVSVHRSFFDTSVRLRALTGSVSRGLERPLLGWGYGAEIEAFLSRYYGFNSQNPENGYVGIFLQLGLVGLAVFLVALAACARAAIRAARRTPSYARVGAAGAAAAGILLGLSQSYFHGPGGIAFVAFWTCLLVAAAPAEQPGTLAP